MVDSIYTDRALAALYDDLNPRGPDTDFFRRAMPHRSSRVLDLGCGTGLLAAELAAMGHRVTAVDPATAMLAIARCRPDGHLVEWIEADALTLDLQHRYDVVLMTGHVFQVFLSDADALRVLTVARRHLQSGGVLMFESRNPAACAWRDWTPDASHRSLDHPEFGTAHIWHEVIDVAGREVRFNTHTRFPAFATEHISESVLAFREVVDIEKLLERAGFPTIDLIGQWDGSALEPDSREIIVRAR